MGKESMTTSELEQVLDHVLRRYEAPAQPSDRWRHELRERETAEREREKRELLDRMRNNPRFAHLLTA
jgi:hypothetical protein